MIPLRAVGQRSCPLLAGMGREGPQHLPFGGQLSDLLFQTCKLYPAYPLLRPYPGETREDLHKNMLVR